MGQCYIFVNLMKYQSKNMGKVADGFVSCGAWLPWLPLLLVDLGHNYRRQSSLQNRCLEFLCDSKHQFPPSVIEQLPKAMQKKLNVTIPLSQYLVGEWAGDRLIITGEYSEYSPFPPHGEWKEGNLWEFVWESGQFNDSHCAKYYDEYRWYRDPEQQQTCQAVLETVLNKLEEFCDGKYHYVVNLDKKEYLNPQAYKAGEKTVLDMAVHKRYSHNAFESVMRSLVIRLIHSTDDSCLYGNTHSLWAGDRIAICTAEQLEEFDSYTDVSNPADDC